MSVVNNKENDRQGGLHGKCTECEGKVWYPFLQWNNLLICKNCISKVKRGLIADLIQFAAIVELQDLGYPGETLHRMSTADLGRMLAQQNRLDEE
jgi:hypothetical protein